MRSRHAQPWVLAITCCFAGLLVVSTAAAGDKQIPGRLGSLIKKGQDIAEDWHINDQEEQDLGAAVSERIRQRYGVVQDPAVHRYVSLVGSVLAQASSRPNLAWKFIVLDTDGVNAFAAPGGFIHITRGALALMANEAELADVLGHEISHVTAKHTIKTIQGDKVLKAAAGRAKLSRDSQAFRMVTDKITEAVLAGYGRGEELDADQKGIVLANSIGYAPTPFVDFLTRLSERNRESSTKQGLFASHPEMQERIAKLRGQIASQRLASTATLADRYHKFISYKPVDLADIASVEAGAAGLTGGGGKSGSDKNAEKKDPPKKKGFGLGSLLAPGSQEKKSAEVTGSAAARGVDNERNAKGGSVATIVTVNLTPEEIAAFKKEGNLR